MAGVPRNPRAEHREPADEMPDIAHEPDGDDGDFGPSEQNLNGGISADAGAVLQSISESVLAEQSMAWKAASHNGWCPFNALGFSGARAAWQRISRESLTKWSRATAAKPVSLFPDQGLSMKVLLDRIGELWVDGGFGARDQFLKTYILVPRLPAVGGCPRFLAVLAQRSAICGTDLCPARHPPLQVTRNLQKMIDEICNRTGRQRVPLSWPVTENVLCCCVKIIDAMNGSQTHAPY